MYRSIIAFALLIFSMLSYATSYNTTVAIENAPLNSQTKQAAFKQALQQVLMLTSGHSVDTNKLPKQILPLVAQYQFKHADNVHWQLQVHFNPQAVNHLLAQQHLTPWPLPRPDTLMWVKISLPSGKTEIIDEQDDSPIKNLLMKQASLRALDLFLPTLDIDFNDHDLLGEQLSLSTLLTLSKPYHIKTIASLDITTKETGYAATLSINEPATHLVIEANSETQLIEKSLDELGLRLQQRAKTTLKTVNLTIENVNSPDTLSQIQAQLSKLSSVHNVDVADISPDMVTFEIKTYDDLSQLKQAIAHKIGLKLTLIHYNETALQFRLIS